MEGSQRTGAVRWASTRAFLRSPHTAQPTIRVRSSERATHSSPSLLKSRYGARVTSLNTPFSTHAHLSWLLPPSSRRRRSGGRGAAARGVSSGRRLISPLTTVCSPADVIRCNAPCASTLSTVPSFTVCPSRRSRTGLPWSRWAVWYSSRKGANPFCAYCVSTALSSPNNLSNSVEAGMQCMEAVPRASCALWKRAWTEAAFSTSLGRTKLMPMPMTVAVLPSLRTVSIRMPPSLSLPATKSFGHLICMSKPDAAKARRQASATAGASEPSSCCGLSNIQPKLNIRHSPSRCVHLRPCRPRPLVCRCATQSDLWACSGEVRARFRISSLLDVHSCFKVV